jgi:hypothetical protein
VRANAKDAAKEAEAPTAPTKEGRPARLARQAAPLHGRQVRKAFKEPDSRRRRLQLGTLEYLGDNAYPKQFKVRFANGQEELMSLATATKLLVPLPATPAVAAAALLSTPPDQATPTTPAVAIVDLPARWDLAQPDQLRQALQQLIPGDWRPNHISHLATQLPGGSRFLQQSAPQEPLMPECVVTLPGEVERLLQCVSLPLCGTIWDPFCGTGTITAVLRAKGMEVVDNDICSHRPAGSHYDALQPSFYLAAAKHRRGVGAFVTSPPFAALDIALPLLVAAGAAVACVHAPGHYLTSGVAPRFAYMRGLQQQGRLHVVMDLPRGPLGRRCIWLLIFSSNAQRQLLLSPACGKDLGFSL